MYIQNDNLHIYTKGRESDYLSNYEQEDDWETKIFPDDGACLSFVIHRTCLTPKYTNTIQQQNFISNLGNCWRKNVQYYSRQCR